MPSYEKPNPSFSSTPPPDDEPFEPPPPIDLDDVTEETRRRIYDATVAVHFRVPPDTEPWMPFYNADQAQLVVIHLAGRWFASWVSLEEAENVKLGPEAKRPILNIVADDEAPYGVAFHEV